MGIVTPTATAADRAKPRDEVPAVATSQRPDPNAPTIELLPDDGKDRPSNQTGFTVQASYLPFNFSYDFSYSLVSRSFWPSSGGSACVSLRGTGSTDPSYWWRTVKVEMWDAYGADTRRSPVVGYPLDGGYYGYCWYGLNPYHEHYFRLVKDWGGGARIWGDGWASPY